MTAWGAFRGAGSIWNAEGRPTNPFSELQLEGTAARRYRYRISDESAYSRTSSIQLRLEVSQLSGSGLQLIKLQSSFRFSSIPV